MITINVNKGELYYEGDSCTKVDMRFANKAAFVTSMLQALSVLIILASSLISMKSPFALWILANHLQLILLLLLTNAYLPAQVIEFITSSKYALISYSFNNDIKIPIIKDLYSWPEIDQSNEGLQRMGFESGSSFSTNLGIFLTVVPIIFFTVIIGILRCGYLKKEGLKSKTFLKKIIKSCYDVLVFGFFIRVIIEAFLTLSLTSSFEISYMKYSRSAEVGSSILAIIIFSLCIAFLIFGFLHFFSTNSSNFEKKTLIRELYTGLKKSKVALVYPSVWILRRLIFVCIVSFMRNLNFIVILSCLIFIQILFIVMMGFVLPYAKKRGSIIDICNELFFAFYILLLMILKEQTWNDFFIRFMIIMLLSNNAIVAFVLFVGLIKEIIVKFDTPRISERRINPFRTPPPLHENRNSIGISPQDGGGYESRSSSNMGMQVYRINK